MFMPQCSINYVGCPADRWLPGRLQRDYANKLGRHMWMIRIELQSDRLERTGPRAGACTETYKVPQVALAVAHSSGAFHRLRCHHSRTS